MRRFTSVLAFTLLCGVCFYAVFAQEPTRKDSDKDRQQTERQLQFNAQRFIKDFDKNNDGKLSKEEWPEGLREQFEAIDTNSDNQLTADELGKHAAKMSQQRPHLVEVFYYVIDIPEDDATCRLELQQTYDLLKKMDQDNNGQIDPKEIQAHRQQRLEERLNAMFKQLDRNNDSKISKDEARGMWADHFADLDKNNDGSLSRQEVQDAISLKQEARRDGEKDSKKDK